MATKQALSYARDLNFHVFPVHGVNADGSCTCGDSDCSNVGKHPATKNGLKDATNDENKIANAFASSRPYNIGVATGAISGIFVVDIDGMEGEASLKELEEQHGKIPPTLTNLTGRGRHLIFRHPGFRIKNNAGKKLGVKVDIRGDGGYIILPPSKHKSGTYYSWDEATYDIAEAPQWIIDRAKQESLPDVEKKILDHDFKEDDVIKMLDHIPADCSYDEWIYIGMALHNAGLPKAVWNNWSSKGAKYKGIQDIHSHWKSFKQNGGITMGTLIQMAMQGGYEFVTDPNDIDLNVGRAAAEKMKAARRSKMKVGNIDFDKLPKLFRETMEWILSSAEKPQPELALLNIITVAGAVFGRRYASPINTRTNLYCVVLAGTAAGKNHSKKLMKELMIEADLTQYIGGESLISGAGILTALIKAPSQVMHLDEFGMVMEAMMDKRGQSHLKIASKIITELYSSSGEKFHGGAYADSNKEPIVIACPNLSIFGISTFEKYVSVLNFEAIASGELNRFIVFKSPLDNPKRRRGVRQLPPPESLVQGWAQFKPAISQNGIMGVTPITVEWPGLQDRIDDMGDFEDEQVRLNRNGAGALWGRYRENSIKFAMTFAIVREPSKPEICSDDLDFAEAFVRQSVDFMIDMAGSHIAQSSHHSNILYFKQQLKGKGRLTGREVNKLTPRLSGKDRKEAISEIFALDEILIEPVPRTEGQKGPTITHYTLLV